MKKINPSNQETIKAKLFDLLDEYKTVKTSEFTVAFTNLRESKHDLENQHYAIINQISSLRTKLKGSSPEVGAKLLYQIDKLKACSEKLLETLSVVYTQEKDLDVKLETFSSEFACKRAEISTLVLINPLKNETSHIDLELQKLLIEFEDLEFEKGIKAKVDSKINNVELKKEDYDEKKYIELFNSMSE